MLAGCEIGTFKKLTSIDINGEIKSTYTVGECLDLNRAKLLLTYSNDSQSEITIGTNMVSGFDSSTAGEKTLTITYKGKTTQVNYTVSNITYNEPNATEVYRTQSALPANDPLGGANKYLYVCFTLDNGIYYVNYIILSSNVATRAEIAQDQNRSQLTKNLLSGEYQYNTSFPGGKM